MLEYFDVYECLPPCPGHSEDLGRTKVLLSWEFEDLSAKNCEIVDERIKMLCRFPTLVFTRQKEPLSNLILKDTSLTAAELKCIRSVILFAFYGLLKTQRQKCWQLLVEHAAGYDVIEWSPAQLSNGKRLVKTIKKQ